MPPPPPPLPAAKNTRCKKTPKASAAKLRAACTEVVKGRADLHARAWAFSKEELEAVKETMGNSYFTKVALMTAARDARAAAASEPLYLRSGAEVGGSFLPKGPRPKRAPAPAPRSAADAAVDATHAREQAEAQERTEAMRFFESAKQKFNAIPLTLSDKENVRQCFIAATNCEALACPNKEEARRLRLACLDAAPGEDWAMEAAVEAAVEAARGASTIMVDSDGDGDNAADEDDEAMSQPRDPADPAEKLAAAAKQEKAAKRKLKSIMDVAIPRLVKRFEEAKKDLQDAQRVRGKAYTHPSVSVTYSAGNGATAPTDI